MSENAEDRTVTSEILPFFDRDATAKPLIDDENQISKFRFRLPIGEVDDKVEKDEDGDYILPRSKCRGEQENVIILEHSISTEIKMVGLQIWRAALLLADFVIHSKDLFLNKNVMELGSGVGLTTVVAAMFARRVTATDLDLGRILHLIRSNIERNKHLMTAEVDVKGLDFFQLAWSSDLREKIEETDIILAADVIYDNDVTEAFVRTITQILSTGRNKTLYLALEKRYVFTISDLDSVAPCFEHYKTCVEAARSKAPVSGWTLAEVPIDFPQYFNYERTKELVLFRMST